VTTIAELQDLAADIQHARPDWPDIVPISNYLLPWKHLPLDQLRTMALAWVADHGNRTPASLKYMPGVPHKTAGNRATQRTTKEPRCYICGNTRTDCDKLNDFETTRDLPNPHRFESKDEAEHNRSPRQFADALADLDALRKARIDKARSEIRPTKAANAHSLKDRRNPPRRCAGCQGTLAQNEHERHPGCQEESA
jgi:hypothetical protein